MISRENLSMLLQTRRRGAEEAVAAFARKLATDPAHAFKWGEAALEGAVLLRALAQVDEYLAAESTVEGIATMVRREVVDLARRGETSSSGIANLMQRATLQAWAGMLQDIEGK
jgi:hypothetical protein